MLQPLLKSGGHCAHHDVDAAAGRERHDEGDRSSRELLSEATATERKEACQRGRNQNGTTCDHCAFPFEPGRLYARSAGAYVAAPHAVTTNSRAHMSRRPIGPRVDLRDVGFWHSDEPWPKLELQVRKAHRRSILNDHAA
jgi:hypothetical protein